MDENDDVGRNPEDCGATFITIENGVEGAIFTRSQVEKALQEKDAEIARLKEELEATKATLEDEEAAHAETLDMIPPKPSGSVVEDVALVADVVRHGDPGDHTGAADALSRLASQAQAAQVLADALESTVYGKSGCWCRAVDGHSATCASRRAALRLAGRLP